MIDHETSEYLFLL